MPTYTAVVERCADTGLYVGYIPGFPGGAHPGRDTGRTRRQPARSHRAFARRRRATSGCRVRRDPHVPRSRLTVGDVPVLKPREVAAIREQLGVFAFAAEAMDEPSLYALPRGAK